MIKKTLVKIQFTMGLIFLILGIVGMVIPILPTTPFVLLAIYFFDRSSSKFHAWCLKIPGVGRGIDDWNSYRVIRKGAKLQALLLIVASAVVIILKEELNQKMRLLILSILGLVSLFLILAPSKPKADPKVE